MRPSKAVSVVFNNLLRWRRHFHNVQYIKQRLDVRASSVVFLFIFRIKQRICRIIFVEIENITVYILSDYHKLLIGEVKSTEVRQLFS